MFANVDTPADEPLEAGRAAMAGGEWERARDHLRAAVAQNPGDAEAWEQLGWAAWWLSDEATVFDARGRAFRLHRAAGEDGAAARVAAWIATDHREFRGEDAVGRGWLVRARRLLDGLPVGADYGWVALIDGDFALNVDGDALETERLGSMAAAIGRDVGLADLEAVGLGLSGIALVVQGEIEAGMRALDEASAIAAGEELEHPLSGAWSLCCVMSACNGVGDFPRAEQSCATIRAFTERWGCRQLLGVCRSNYGRILATSGDWAGAEAELTAAVGDLERSRPGMLAGSLVRLGELRLRQGRTADARDLFERAGPAGLVGLGEIALDEDDPAGAADTAERVLRNLPEEDRLSRIPALELLARARARLGEPDAARRAADRLAGIAEQIGTPYLRGRARLAAGELAAAAGDHDTAREAFEDAVDCLTAGAAVYDAAVARLRLSRALGELGRHEQAAAESAAAEEVLAALGARGDLERHARAEPAAELSPRELEVLRLVAQGLSDPEIAERLVVSPHTVHRHVANVRTKLRLPSRSAAVAYAAREGLL